MPQTAFHDLSLLFAEDDEAVRQRIGRELSHQYPGLKVLLATNGAEGVALYEARHPDLVLTDINMPVMDGIEMTEKIKAFDEDAVIVALTAHSDSQHLLRAIEVGISSYLLKPVIYEKLFAVLDKYLEDSKLRRELKRKNDHLRKLSWAVENSPVSVVMTDPLGIIEYVNRKFCELTGYTFQEVVGLNASLQKSGLTPRQHYGELWRTVTEGRVWRGEFLNRKKNGDLYWEQASIAPIRDDSGRIIQFVAVKEDITDRKEKEEEIRVLNERLTERAEELEKLNRDLEAFNSMIAHDLRNPLTVINTYIQVISELCGGELAPTCREYLTESYEGTLRMNRLIESLLDFSRLQHRDPVREEVDLSECARGVVGHLRQVYPHCDVRVVIEDGVCGRGDPALLRIVLSNLLGNALKYNCADSNTEVAFGSVRIEGEEVYFVRDNGIGFDAEDAAQIFAPFRRLRGTEEVRGDGIGLATVERIIKRHGGRVWAEGERGRGAAFFFTLRSG